MFDWLIDSFFKVTEVFAHDTNQKPLDDLKRSIRSFPPFRLHTPRLVNVRAL